MTSVVSLCNIALDHIGVPSIADLDEASEEARKCNLHYALTRDTMLQGYPWLFAKKTLVLAEVANVWEERWEHSYTRPSDCLKVRRIVPEIDRGEETNPIPYSVGEGLIFCNSSPAKLEYTKRFEDPAKFPPLFQEALTWALASKICIPLTKDQSLRKDAYQLASQTLNAAQTADANEELSFWDVSSQLIEARS